MANSKLSGLFIKVIAWDCGRPLSIRARDSCIKRMTEIQEIITVSVVRYVVLMKNRMKQIRYEVNNIST